MSTNKPRVIFISNQDLKRADERLDLDESTESSLYLYPHKDRQCNLTKFVNYDEYNQAIYSLDNLIADHVSKIKALEEKLAKAIKIAEFYKNYADCQTSVPALCECKCSFCKNVDRHRQTLTEITKGDE